MQAFSGSIDAQGDPVLHNSKLYLVKSARFIKPGYAVYTLQPFDNSFLDNGLAVGYGKELGVEAVPFYREGPVFRNIVFPGQSLGLFKELLKAQGIKSPDFDHDHLAYS